MADLPAGWRLARLDELGTIERGRSRHRPRNDPILYGGPHPFVQTGDVKAAGLRLFRYSQTYNDAGLAQSRLWPVGTLCITIAANICDTAILGLPACFPDSIVGFTPREGVSDVVFVKYAVDLAKQRFTNISRGATQDNLSIEKLLSQQLPIPAFKEQRRIAWILGAYDDLIETNRRRIALLEEMARGFFDEWFVHFRFPNHDSRFRVEPVLGEVPIGWEVKSVEAFCPLVVRGVTPKYKSGSGRFIINQKANRGSELSTEELKELDPALAIPQEKYARFGDVLVNCLGEGTIGRVHFFTERHQEWAVDQHMSICRASSANESLYVYFSLESDTGQNRIKALKTGATSMTMLNISALRAFALVAPPASLIDRFGEIVSPLMRQKQALTEINRNLLRTRDLLLPILISGQLSVATAERDLEAVA